MGTACAYPVARCALGTLRSSAALCAIQHRVPLMQGQQGLIDTGAPMMAQSVIPEHDTPILVVPSNPSQSLQSQSIRLPHWQSDSILVNSSLLHIITYYKDNIFSNSFTCTGLPDPIDPGHFKFASRNLVGLPISMPLIDTNRLRTTTSSS